MTPAIALLIIGAILLKAGFKNQNVIDVLLGRDTENPGGRVPASTLSLGGQSVDTSGALPLSQTPGQVVTVPGTGPLETLGRLIGFPYKGTHTIGNWQSDNAVDISAPVGTAMRALEDGTIAKVTKHPQGAGRFAGDQITLAGKTNSYFYAHGVSSVKAGDKVKAGQKIGTTGSANGVAHLHLGIMRGNPLTLLSGWLHGR